MRKLTIVNPFSGVDEGDRTDVWLFRYYLFVNKLAHCAAWIPELYTKRRRQKPSLFEEGKVRFVALQVS